MKSFLKDLYNSLAIHSILAFLDDESGRIVSDRGMYVLSNPKLYEEIMDEHEKSKTMKKELIEGTIKGNRKKIKEGKKLSSPPPPIQSKRNDL